MLISVVIPVLRDAERAIHAVDAVHRLALPEGASLEVIVVDDGSGDESAARIESACAGRARVLRLPVNLGRAGARNAGARMAGGEFVLFLDCDCEPASENFLIEHLRLIGDHAVGSCGRVEGDGQGFWHWYQCQASNRRASQARRGSAYAGTSQNCLIRRASFLRIGGFDERYRAYGFEDRDLLIRLGSCGGIAWTDTAVVRHLDLLSMAAVGKKMSQAGELSGPLFRASHPQAYRALGYAAGDVSVRPWLKPLAWCWQKISGYVIAAVDGLIEHQSVSYRLISPLVRWTTGLCYLCGTWRASRRSPGG